MIMLCLYYDQVLRIIMIHGVAIIMIMLCLFLWSCFCLVSWSCYAYFLWSCYAYYYDHGISIIMIVLWSLYYNHVMIISVRSCCGYLYDHVMSNEVDRIQPSGPSVQHSCIAWKQSAVTSPDSGRRRLARVSEAHLYPVLLCQLERY